MSGTTSALARADVPTGCSAGWSLVSTPNPGTIYSVLEDVAAVGDDQAWSVGFRAYLDKDGLFANSAIILGWNGAKWPVAHKPRARGQLAGVHAVAPDDVWAVGHSGMESVDYRPLIMHWDGADWSRTQAPRVARGYLTAIGGAATDDLWAAGTRIGKFETIVLHWDGKRWRKTRHPATKSDYVAVGAIAASAADEVLLVGTWLDTEGRNAPLALRWNGERWRRTQPVVASDHGTAFEDVTATGGGTWAVGSVTDDEGGLQPGAQRWDGTAWQLAPPPMSADPASFAAVTSGDRGVWAVGTRRPADEPTATFISRWRPASQSWQEVASPGADGDDVLLGVDQTSEGELWAVGFHRTDEQERTLALHRC